MPVNTRNKKELQILDLDFYHTEFSLDVACVPYNLGGFALKIIVNSWSVDMEEIPARISR